MPYTGELASRIGHVPTVNNERVKEALEGWVVSQAAVADRSAIESMCVAVDDLPAQRGRYEDVGYSITVDGSTTEVETTRDHPTVKVGYLRVAGSLVNLDEFRSLRREPFIDPRRIKEAHEEYSFDAALPGAGLARPGMTGRDTWRLELDTFLAGTRFDAESPMTLADALLAIHNPGGVARPSLTLRVCPVCDFKPDMAAAPLAAGPGCTCPNCGTDLYLADTLRLHEEFNAEGTNFAPVTRAMNVAERLMTTCYIEYFAAKSPEVLRHTIFITDGPLALHGPVAPQSRAFLAHHQARAASLGESGIEGPLLVGVEKSGAFVEHANLIRDHVPPQAVMLLTNDYINRVTGRPASNQYGTDEFYGRRFLYRASTGDILVLTVVPHPGVSPYSPATSSEDLESYPHLGVICRVLDSLRTRMYSDAVIPVALAHSSASLPLGVGRSVLTKMAQQHIPGLRSDHQAIRGPSYL